MYKRQGQYLGFLEGFHLKLAFGLIQMLPIFVVAHVVGLGIEFFYAAKKGHGIEEGFLVSGALIPLIMPPDIPIWILTLSVAFAVIIGKEAFGGTGMNIWNIALLSRVFVFFAYPLTCLLYTSVKARQAGYGKKHIDIGVPGEDILTTTDQAKKYTTESGTSLSAPILALSLIHI